MPRTVTRRTVLAASAWSMPVVALAIAAPGAAASTDPVVFTITLTGNVSGFGAGLGRLTLIGANLPENPVVVVDHPTDTAFNIAGFSSSPDTPQSEVILSGYANTYISITAYGVTREFFIPQNGNVSAIAPPVVVSTLALNGTIDSAGRFDGTLDLTGSGLPAAFGPPDFFAPPRFGGGLFGETIYSSNSVTASGGVVIIGLPHDSGVGTGLFSVGALGVMQDYSYTVPGTVTAVGAPYAY